MFDSAEISAVSEEELVAIAVAVINALRGIPQIAELLDEDTLVEAVAQGLVTGLNTSKDRIQ